MASGGGINRDSSVLGLVEVAGDKVLAAASTAATSEGVRHSLTADNVISVITSSTSASALLEQILNRLGPATGESGSVKASIIKKQNY